MAIEWKVINVKPETHLLLKLLAKKANMPMCELLEKMAVALAGYASDDPEKTE